MHSLSQPDFDDLTEHLIEKTLSEQNQMDKKTLQNAYKQAKWEDAIGLRCPMPLLRAKQALKQMDVGECLIVLATDPSAKGDFSSMLKHTSHGLLADISRFSFKESVFDVYIIQKGE